jgi:hypothetical protein
MISGSTLSDNSGIHTVKLGVALWPEHCHINALETLQHGTGHQVI